MQKWLKQIVKNISTTFFIELSYFAVIWLMISKKFILNYFEFILCNNYSMLNYFLHSQKYKNQPLFYLFLNIYLDHQYDIVWKA